MYPSGQRLPAGTVVGRWSRYLYARRLVTRLKCACVPRHPLIDLQRCAWFADVHACLLVGPESLAAPYLALAVADGPCGVPVPGEADDSTATQPNEFGSLHTPLTSPHGGAPSASIILITCTIVLSTAGFTQLAFAFDQRWTDGG